MKIFWTYKNFNDKFFEGHAHEGKHCVVAIAIHDSGFCDLFTGENSEFIHTPFDTKEEAIFHATQALKVEYSKVYGVHYELVELDSDSNEWYDVYEKWETFLTNLVSLNEWVNLPWWKRLFKKINWK